MSTSLPADAVAVAMLPMGEIVPSPSNPRKHFDDAYLAELAESIKSHGLIQPITVRPLPFENFLEFNKRRPGGRPDRDSRLLARTRRQAGARNPGHRKPAAPRRASA
ncbi:MAG: ParB N-terminal domain-containing protein [Gammaproteobacteria bacterium]|nr:hypothetical protein [Rhodocyclaceae bacterium]MBU3908893.1 ParB N-terminal domain-containing protein [Gammaproteobacteria bacterium]MBU3987760.1 ParB N-terminal domain-containing protein [Gammaproteobacteria bacterium]MBU4003371.1 ParB N-terminal domain-containing protein [Gammaproteobacteria bacterium]MBU4021842.1 ParB N-terminal domain-containing protein [Gammaproteobacteria bacterium]